MTSDELDRIDWGRLEHAYGSAKDVPGLIRDLTSRRRKKRERALYELFGNIHHQGTVYSATGPAVPFLVALVLSEDTDYRVRVELTWLLQGIAGGTGSRESVRAARDAVGAELPSLVPLIGKGAPELSLSVAGLAGYFPEQSEQTLPLVQRAYEAAPSPAASRLLAIVRLLLGDRSGGLMDEVRSASEEDADPEILAAGLAGLDGGQIPEALALLEDLTGAALRGWDDA